MSLHDHKRDAWHRSLGEDAVPVALDPATRRAIEQAAHLAKDFHDRGRLLKPFEAMAVACKDGHSTETLYSLARTTAFATGGDIDIILKHLEREWPDFA
jgi:hypothetical protein